MKNVKVFDAIVLGAGGVGSAAICHLARRGVRVLGIDRFHPPHDRGSSHGQSRVIRQAYFEHPDYVPLLKESYGLWRELESSTGRSLLYQIGIVSVGPASGVVVAGVMQAAETHSLTVEPLPAAEIGRRWPGLHVGGDLTGVFDPAGGYLLVEECVQAHIHAAQSAGAEFLMDTEVRAWSTDGRSFRLRTSNGEVACERLVISAGAGTAKLLEDLKSDLEVRRKSLFWFETDAPEYDVAAGFPIFFFELPAGLFYGFPKLDARGVKLAEHSGGRTVVDPLTVDHTVDMIEQQRLVDFKSAHLPGVSQRVTDHSVCLYTMSPDEHFILDRHPKYANLIVAAGLSGHGFKFTPALGRALADLAIDGRTNLPIGFLSLKRVLQKH